MQIRTVILHEVGPFDHLELHLPEGRDPARADIHLLVGPNGSGKSTLLASVAQCFSPAVSTGFSERARSDESFVAVQTTTGWFGARPASAHGRPIEVPGGRLEWENVGAARLYCSEASGLDVLRTSTQPLAALRTGPPVRDVVLAYAGTRSLVGPPLVGLTELTDNPLRDAASFGRSAPSPQFGQWTMNTLAEAALARDRGDDVVANQRRTAVDRVREALERVVERPVRLEPQFRPSFGLRVAVGDAAPVPVDLLPDGLQALLAWLGDVLVRLDRVPWTEVGPPNERDFVLLLDEVDAHLHPSWQRRVLPMAEVLFPRAQILCSTHSPFVVGSAADATIHLFRLAGGHATASEPRPSARGTSVGAVLDTVFEVEDEFDVDTEAHLDRFRELWMARLGGEPGVEAELTEQAAILRGRSAELATIVETELRELNRRLTRAASA